MRPRLFTMSTQSVPSKSQPRPGTQSVPSESQPALGRAANEGVTLYPRFRSEAIEIHPDAMVSLSSVREDPEEEDVDYFIVKSARSPGGISLSQFLADPSRYVRSRLRSPSCEAVITGARFGLCEDSD